MYRQIVILLLASLAALSIAADTADQLPASFTCKSPMAKDKKGNPLTHTFKGENCMKAIAMLAKGDVPKASCYDCLLGLVGKDGKAFTPKKALNHDALLAGVKHIAATCKDPTPKHQKRDDKAKPDAQVVLGLSPDASKC
ncbi:hypothetical protein PTTG_12601 [Puccinia triticina 1-1 BBBD Race 1]|uniref:Uncharacterized protein n=2 Tax=Puccinia triticina TaxID=208348 RepID=A0A180GC84_PUCT1|nr:uncharacterized protein PtA15_6A887 [Puccinia triticina]OAV90270.1 hypothetical protein PTTG_12601 [Puccinia triticina 1-1 BBBD Race 1]WAQ86255.1 hypothetical protein PtA15_6A887 [Puccinia triticina]WAR56137.1 hypothetical protein PtB15_6B882 [Puccinia triticina]